MSTCPLLYHGFALGTIDIVKTTYQAGRIHFHVRRPARPPAFFGPRQR